jgi:coenzyme F420-0:L-glutamate ligase/coenzyme F420-1:gamma-L-glutamate ligase
LRLEVLPIRIEGEVRPGDKLDDLILLALDAAGERLHDGDVVVIGHKVVSKSEARTVTLSTVKPSEQALEIAKGLSKDPRVVELILSESKEIVALARGIMISETRHGLICANAGVDLSNVKKGAAVLLPLDPDKSAQVIRQALSERLGLNLAVVISDTFGRPFRNGQTNVAIGASGIEPIKSYIGTADMYGNKLQVTEIAVADELAAAAELVMGKADSIPVAIVRGYEFHYDTSGSAAALVRPKDSDLFRFTAPR